MVCVGVLCALVSVSEPGTQEQGWGTPELVGPGVVSTTNTEFNTTLSPEGDVLVLTRYDDATGVGTIESLRLVDGVWEQTDYFDGQLDGVDAGDGHLSPDGKRFLMYRDADVWTMQRDEEGKWSEPSAVPGEISTREPEAYPTVSKDGELCFTRQAVGNWDIYLAQPDGDVWGKPDRLGAPINTRYREHDALLTPDGKRLIFVRMGEPEGPGLSDLYMSERTDDGWSEPELLPFNTGAIDGSPCLSPDGNWLYFTSGRATGTPKASGLCIWRVRTPWADAESGAD